ncbi:hypothetical protein EOW77_0026770 [Bradyrhizobium yuanmingense]|uniref:hypothetical protein n=1 Tax=Bradyrhizobium yuanmingense TaxID=108015 RepID=UPI000FE43F8C|nr:hypothetical protein [Bradyrhizobium yuanmingense]TGN82058.1 hypothetical protein EOW77_0026770 [Bradyrhizobium yuanmingense]
MTEHAIMMSSPYASLQEELVFNFSKRILGPHSLFCPDNFGHSKEPADLVWVADRCAILMYMQRSVASYEKKTRHNLKQLRKWLRKWRAGQPLCGRTAGASGTVTSFELHFTDIDHIVGLSVIGDGELGCEYHADLVRENFAHKLAACSTITERCLLELARMGAGPRDIVHWLSHLHGHRRRITEGQLIGAIRFKDSADLVLVRETIAATQGPVFALPSAIDQSSADKFLGNAQAYVAATFGSVRGHEVDTDDIGRLTVDLTLSDIYWFGILSALYASRTAAPGKHGPLVLGAKRRSGIYDLRFVLAANSKALRERFPDLAGAIGDTPGLTMLQSLDVGRDSPWGMLLFHPRTGPSYLRLQIEQLRSATLSAI